MKVIIAEKPSVAREIARVVRATNKKEGYIEGGGYAVTWALGHLITAAMPEAYGIKGFHKENLPILPPVFTLIPRQIKEGKGYKADPAAVAQLKVIEKLFRECEGIIVATDAGREGELIFRFIYEYLGIAKPFEHYGSVRSRIKPLEQDYPISKAEPSTTIFTVPPVPAAKPTGWWVSMPPKPYPLRQEEALTPWVGYRLRLSVWSVPVSWRTRSSSRSHSGNSALL